MRAARQAGAKQTGAQASTTLADHLTLSLSEDKTSASVGDSLTYLVTLTNSTTAPITSTYVGYGPVGTTLDALVVSYGSFSVKDSHGNLIGNDGGPAFTGLPLRVPDSLTFTLQPGQSLPYTTTYRFQPGAYTTAVALQKTDLTLTSAAGPLTVTVH